LHRLLFCAGPGLPVPIRSSASLQHCGAMVGSVARCLLVAVMAVHAAKNTMPAVLLQLGSRSAKTLSAGCADTDSNCEWWESQGYCEPSSPYFSHVKGACEASCGLCDNAGGATAASTPAPTSRPTAGPAAAPTTNGTGSSGTGSKALADALELADLVNQYRAGNGLAAVPLSPALMATASVKVHDLNRNMYSVGCNLHSWSTLSSTVQGCCYNPSSPDGPCMWEKPRKVTDCWAQPYLGNGYENAMGPGTLTPQKCLDGWRNSQHHNDVMLNRGPWAGGANSVIPNPWPAMGVAIEGDHCVLWMGDTADPNGQFNAQTASRDHPCCVPSYCQSF